MLEVILHLYSTLSLFKHEPAAVLRDGAVNEGLLAKQTNRDEQIGDEWRGEGDDSQASKKRHNQISQDDAGLRPPLSSLNSFSTLLRCSSPSFLSSFLCPFSSIFLHSNLRKSAPLCSFRLVFPPVPHKFVFSSLTSSSFLVGIQTLLFTLQFDGKCQCFCRPL